MGIKVLPPDVNESDSEYTPRGSDIIYQVFPIEKFGDPNWVKDKI